MRQGDGAGHISSPYILDGHRGVGVGGVGVQVISRGSTGLGDFAEPIPYI